MEKPSITIDPMYDALVWDKARFAAVHSIADTFNHITLAPPNNDKLLISIVNTELPPCRDIEWLWALDAHIRDNEYLQTYVIWDCEYAWVKRYYSPYEVLSRPNHKLLFTSNLGQALDYGVALVEKACKYGIYG